MEGPNSEKIDGGPNGTPQPYLVADMSVDPKTNRLYIADGYGNRRILIVDAATGQYVGHFGAYGQNPVVDDPELGRGRHRRRPVDRRLPGRQHETLVLPQPDALRDVSRDGFLYACDRGNNRVQIFEIGAADLGKPCANPSAESGKCGFVGEIHVAPQTASGTSGTATLSTDPEQSCLYVGDLANGTLYIINRENLTSLTASAGRPPSRRVPLAPCVGRRFARQHLHRRSGHGAARAEVPEIRLFELQRHRQRRSRRLQREQVAELSMTNRRISVAISMLLAVLAATSARAQSTFSNPDMPPVNDLPNPYSERKGMPLPDGREWGSTAGVDAGKGRDDIWAIDRCGSNTCVGSHVDSLLHYDGNGNLLGQMGADLFAFPHGIHVDEDGNVWVTDPLPPTAAARAATSASRSRS